MAEFALAGLSMGGIVGLEMWRQARERIAGLAFLDTNYLADTEEKQQMRLRQIQQVRQGELEGVDTSAFEVADELASLRFNAE